MRGEHDGMELSMIDSEHLHDLGGVWLLSGLRKGAAGNNIRISESRRTSIELGSSDRDRC